VPTDRPWRGSGATLPSWNGPAVRRAKNTDTRTGHCPLCDRGIFTGQTATWLCGRWVPRLGRAVTGRAHAGCVKKEWETDA
jgi:hypothetical protein